MKEPNTLVAGFRVILWKNTVTDPLHLAEGEILFADEMAELSSLFRILDGSSKEGRCWLRYDEA